LGPLGVWRAVGVGNGTEGRGADIGGRLGARAVRRRCGPGKKKWRALLCCLPVKPSYSENRQRGVRDPGDRWERRLLCSNSPPPKNFGVMGLRVTRGVGWSADGRTDGSVGPRGEGAPGRLEAPAATGRFGDRFVGSLGRYGEGKGEGGMG